MLGLVALPACYQSWSAGIPSQRAPDLQRTTHLCSTVPVTRSRRGVEGVWRVLCCRPVHLPRGEARSDHLWVSGVGRGGQGQARIAGSRPWPYARARAWWPFPSADVVRTVPRPLSAQKSRFSTRRMAGNRSTCTDVMLQELWAGESPIQPGRPEAMETSMAAASCSRSSRPASSSRIAQTIKGALLSNSSGERKRCGQHSSHVGCLSPLRQSHPPCDRQTPFRYAGRPQPPRPASSAPTWQRPPPPHPLQRPGSPGRPPPCIMSCAPLPHPGVRQRPPPPQLLQRPGSPGRPPPCILSTAPLPHPGVRQNPCWVPLGTKVVFVAGLVVVASSAAKFELVPAAAAGGGVTAGEGVRSEVVADHIVAASCAANFELVPAAAAGGGVTAGEGVRSEDKASC